MPECIDLLSMGQLWWSIFLLYIFSQPFITVLDKFVVTVFHWRNTPWHWSACELCKMALSVVRFMHWEGCNHWWCLQTNNWTTNLGWGILNHWHNVSDSIQPSYFATFQHRDVCLQPSVSWYSIHFFSQQLSILLSPSLVDLFCFQQVVLQWRNLNPDRIQALSPANHPLKLSMKTKIFSLYLDLFLYKLLDLA